MKRAIIIIIILFFLYMGFGGYMRGSMQLITKLQSAADVVDLFYSSSDHIRADVQKYSLEAKQLLDNIILIPDNERTFKNTLQAFDHVCTISNLAIIGNIIGLLNELHPDETIRQVGQEMSIQLESFWIDNVTSNTQLYAAIKAYAQSGLQKENLNAQQKRFLDETMKDFIRSGMDLPEETQRELTMLKKEIGELCLEFSQNIAIDASYIKVKQSELEGLDNDFIDTLKKDPEGLCILGVDYPTYNKVMENCSIEATRKAMVKAFDNRAYPANEEIIKNIFARRDSLAKKLGFIHYAAYDLDNQMVKDVNRATNFLQDLFVHAKEKASHEIEIFKTVLPPGITLENDKIKPWDYAYICNYYKKHYCNLDEQRIAEYFPFEKTMAGLLAIYTQFFSINFKRVPTAGLWHPDVELLEVWSGDNEIKYGYIFLDLFPRPNKYSHAAHGTVVPATWHNGQIVPSVSIVFANFTKPTDQKPALFTRNDVTTFFHEFGHALHATLGRTVLASQSGTNVMRDFVELPSQLLERWLLEGSILKMISSHYESGASLPDEIIADIINQKNLTSGNFIQRQVLLSLLALHYHMSAESDPYTTLQNFRSQYNAQFAPNPDNHMYASWGHLSGYAAKYYGYMWALVFAEDVFATIKKEGLLNPVVGKRYSDTIISKGGSVDPNELLKAFLGRDPNNKAFLDNLNEYAI